MSRSERTRSVRELDLEPDIVIEPRENEDEDWDEDDVEELDGSEDESSQATKVDNFLSKLKAPESHANARNRKRVRAFNAKKVAKRPRSAQCSAKEYLALCEKDSVLKPLIKNGTLRLDPLNNKVMRCAFCCKVMPLHKQSIKNHLQTKLHCEKKEIAERTNLYATTITATMASLTPHEKAQHVLRETWVETLLVSGIPLQKSDRALRGFVERNSAKSLEHSSHFGCHIPAILSRRQAELSKAVHGHEVAIVFDGTPWADKELFAVVVRFVDHTFQPRQLLAAFKMLAGSLCHEQEAHLLTKLCLKAPLNLDLDQIIGAMYDRASTNKAAIKKLRLLFDYMLPVPCMSHTLARVGSYFATPTLDRFISLWCSMFSKSYKARRVWSKFVDGFITVNQIGETRWWATYEAVEQAAKCFGDITAFINGDLLDGSFAPKKAQKLKALVNPASAKYVDLMVEMAIYCDAGKKLCQATYSLEGDGVLMHLAFDLIVSAYDHLDALVGGRSQAQMTAAVVTRLAAPGMSTPAVLAQQQALFQQALNCIRPALNYFNNLLQTELAQTLNVFRAARLINPLFVWRSKPTPDDINIMREFPFVQQQHVLQLQAELADYTRACAETAVDGDLDVPDWWRRHKSLFPGWALMAKRIFTMQPSSAAAERVFSRFNCSFGQQQTAVLEDYVEASMMCQVNCPP